MRDRIPFRAAPMLPTLVPQAFNSPGWTYEEKYDGDRLLAYKEGDSVKLLTRNAKDHTSKFPAIVSAIERLKPRALLLDGEVVIFDRKRLSRFQLLQQGRGEPVYAVFDCLYSDGKDLRREPLSARRKILEKTIPTKGPLILSHQLSNDGLEAFKSAKKVGYEGLVAKDLSSPYVEGRTRMWLKVKVHQEDEFVIGGYTAPAGSRQHFGALLLGAYEKGKLRYVGKVGTGFDEKTLAVLDKKFQPLVARKSPFAEIPPERSVTFLEPRLVAQISYQELTADRKLRQPVYLGLRDDKNPKDVHIPEANA